MFKLILYFYKFNSNSFYHVEILLENKNLKFKNMNYEEIHLNINNNV